MRQVDRRKAVERWSSRCRHKRPEIASRLGLSERAVKRDLLEIMDEARPRSRARQATAVRAGNRSCCGLPTTSQASFWNRGESGAYPPSPDEDHAERRKEEL